MKLLKACLATFIINIFISLPILAFDLPLGDKENEIGIKTRISNILSWILSIEIMISFALLALILHVFNSNEVNEFFLYLFKPFALMSFGLSGFKLFQNVEGIFGIVFKLFGLFIAFVGFMYFFQ